MPRRAGRRLFLNGTRSSAPLPVPAYDPHQSSPVQRVRPTLTGGKGFPLPENCLSSGRLARRAAFRASGGRGRERTGSSAGRTRGFEPLTPCVQSRLDPTSAVVRRWPGMSTSGVMLGFAAQTLRPGKSADVCKSPPVWLQFGYTRSALDTPASDRAKDSRQIHLGGKTRFRTPFVSCCP